MFFPTPTNKTDKNPSKNTRGPVFLCCFWCCFLIRKEKKHLTLQGPKSNTKKQQIQNVPQASGQIFRAKFLNLKIFSWHFLVCVCVCRCPLLFHQSFLLVTFHRGGAVKKTGWVKKNGGPVAPRYILAVVSAGPGRLICFFCCVPPGQEFHLTFSTWRMGTPT